MCVMRCRVMRCRLVLQDGESYMHITYDNVVAEPL